MRMVVVGAVGGLVLTLFSLIRGEYFPWPDFTHWRHGFPFFWLTHQTSSIAGPVDNWFLDHVAFAASLLFWAAVTFFLYAAYRQRSNLTRK